MLFHKYTDGQYKQFGQGIRCVFAMFPIIYVHCPICFLAFSRAKLSPITTSAYHQVKSIFSSKVMCICTTSCFGFNFALACFLPRQLQGIHLEKNCKRERWHPSTVSWILRSSTSVKHFLLVGSYFSIGNIAAAKEFSTTASQRNNPCFHCRTGSLCLKL